MTMDVNTPAQIAAYLSAANFSILEQKMIFENKNLGTHLFWESEAASSCFYIKQGLVKVYKITEDGQELILHLLQAGDFYMEIGGSEARFNCSAVVMENSVVGCISTSSLEDLVSSSGSFAVEFMKWMGLLHRTTQSKFRDLMLYGKNGALASTLIRMSNSYGEPCEQGIRIQLKMTKTEIANLMGTTREGVSRMLSAYQEQGAIAYLDGHLVIRDLAYLRSIVQCPDCPPDICRM
ncbi:Crp/Fnr family transcriptional regulator [Paenibacillus sp. UNC451MF]|uniref:Crp/Fnr family transcriptional regulator n=1 Tax=Paenibacillus sp. UNC451MF TaxID=1449063 RepID=UPI00068C0C88|nr:Crp/Fnr family transcriptional regulator [Paenibacillus sp. UNC451MF]